MSSNVAIQMRHDVNPVHRAYVQRQEEPVFLMPRQMWPHEKHDAGQNLLFNDLSKTFRKPMIHLVSLYLAIDHTCVPCDDVGGSKRLRNVDHNLRLHTHMLYNWSAAVSSQRHDRTNVRFSPV